MFWRAETHIKQYKTNRKINCDTISNIVGPYSWNTFKISFFVHHTPNNPYLRVGIHALANLLNEKNVKRATKITYSVETLILESCIVM